MTGDGKDLRLLLHRRSVGPVVALRATPLTRDTVNEYLRARHRHHGAVSGYRFAVGAANDTGLVGVAVVGRPRARLIDQYTVAEVTRMCTDGTKNACSFLYSTCSRVCRDLGFSRVFTCILDSESGASLKAAGWVYEYTTRDGSQDRPSRRRVDKSPTCPKQVWAPRWCAESELDREAQKLARILGHSAAPRRAKKGKGE